MIRRSFRIGLTLGLLAGLAFALAKVLGNRPAPEAAAPAPSQPWPRLATDPSEPARPTQALQPDPDAPARRSPVATPASPPAADPAPPPPAAEPPARKAPATSAPATKTTAAKQPAAKAPAAKQPIAKKAAKKKPLVAPWVEPSGDVCPTSHPVKGKLASKIFHLPGMLNYDRTKPDRCYRDVTAAETDGLRPAKR